MAKPSQNPSSGKKKATYEEKGKRKAVEIEANSDSDSSFTPSQRFIPQQPRSQGLRISENRSPTTTPAAMVPRPEEEASDISFKSPADKTIFDTKFATRKLTKCKIIDFTFFLAQGFLFPLWLQIAGLQTFLTACTEVSDLVIRKFYFYFQYDTISKRYTSFVNGQHLSFTREQFSEILEIPFYEEEDTFEDVPVEDKLFSLTENQALCHSNFGPLFAKNLKSTDLRILFNIICCCVYPRAGGMDKIYSDDINMMYILQMGLKINLGTYMLKFMMDQKNRVNGHLPFGMAITRLLSHFKIIQGSNKPVKLSSYAHINESTLKRMRIVKNNGDWVEKSQTKQASNKHEDFPEPTLPSPDFIPPSPIQNSFSIPTSTPSVPTSQVDFSSLISYFDTQFSALNNKVSLLDSKVDSIKFEINNKFDTITSDIETFKTEVKTKFTEVQDMVDQVEASAATSRTKSSSLLQEIFSFLNTQTHSLISVVNSANTTLQDIRDNSDRVCLEHNIPSLQALLDERFAELKAEFQSTQPPPPPSQSRQYPFHTKNFKAKQAKAARTGKEYHPKDTSSKPSSPEPF